MIALILALVYLGYWNPSWIAYVIIAVILPLVQIFFVSAMNDGDASGAAPSIMINSLIFVVLGAIVVAFAKRSRRREAEEMEMLIRLTQRPPAD